MNKYRSVSKIIDPEYVIEGAGVLLRRSIAPRVSNEFDPFLLFDHFAFNNPIEGPIRGFPMHPHRGIETVTYMLEGMRSLALSGWHWDDLGRTALAMLVVFLISFALCFAALRSRVRRS